MGGISFFLGTGPHGRAVELVRSMCHGLRHRSSGPTTLLMWDASGCTIQSVGGVSDTSAVLDVAAPGSGPSVVLGARGANGNRGSLALEDGRRFAVVLDGTLYNAADLRRSLEAGGHCVREDTPAELLLAAYAQWGHSFLGTLRGAFAIALLDEQAGTVVVARDGFGVRPLFYRRVPDGWAFSSEIGPLLDAAGGERVVRPGQVLRYLQTGLSGWGSGEGTIFHSVSEVPPGSFAVLDARASSAPAFARHWSPDVTRVREISFNEATRTLHDTFLRSVEEQLGGGGPVGVILSGGADSSAIAMALREVGGANLDIHTFSYIGDQGATSEERWVDMVTEACGSQPHKLRLDPESWTLEPRAAARQGEPHGSLAIHVQGRLYAMAAAAGVRQTFGGVGSDGLLAGRSRYWPSRLAGLVARGRLTDAAAFLRATSVRREPWEVSASALLRGVGFGLLPGTAKRRIAGARGWKPWVDPAYAEAHGIRPSAPSRPAGRYALRHAIVDELDDGLPTLLRYEDRNSTRHGVSAHLPFLSVELADLALSLPDEFLVGPDGTPKRVFNEAMRGLVPDAILNRTQLIGFDVPLHTWPPRVPVLGDLFASALALPPVRSEYGEAVRTRLAEGRDLDRADAFPFWRLVGLAEWARSMDVTFR